MPLLPPYVLRWQHRQSIDEYDDYECVVADADLSVHLVLTLNRHEHTAWMDVLVNDSCGTEHARGAVHHIPWPVACAMADQSPLPSSSNF